MRAKQWSQIKIGGTGEVQRARQTGQKTVDELFSLMKLPSVD